VPFHVPLASGAFVILNHGVQHCRMLLAHDLGGGQHHLGGDGVAFLGHAGAGSPTGHERLQHLAQLGAAAVQPAHHQREDRHHADAALARDPVAGALHGHEVARAPDVINIGVDAGTALLYIDSARVGAAVQVPDPVGQRFGFHLVAPGLVAMTAWAPERLDEYLSASLAPATEHSVTEPRAIRDRIDRVRQDGFVWTDQELDLDVNGVAAPIRSADGSLVAARLAERLLVAGAEQILARGREAAGNDAAS